jgi:cell pole-organizing protein PopZ
MEEILASIRRIIADDDAGKSPPRAADPVPPPTPAAQQQPARPAPPPPPRPVAAVPPPRPAPPPPVASVETVAKEDEIESMLSDLKAQETAPAADVLDLTESMAAPPRTDGFRTIDGQSDIVFDDSPDEPAPKAARGEVEERPLMSSLTSAAVDSAFNSLAHTVLVQNARTLEDLVREMLRPLLKTWLDDNLPGLVERLVRAEIERVSRGRG